MNYEELRAYCFLVKRGKPAASIPLQERDVSEACKLVDQEEKLHHYIERLADDWVTFWVFRYPHILEVIKNIPQTPKTAFDHWVLGKLFGYEEGAIQEFIQDIT